MTEDSGPSDWESVNRNVKKEPGWVKSFIETHSLRPGCTNVQVFVDLDTVRVVFEKTVLQHITAAVNAHLEDPCRITEVRSYTTDPEIQIKAFRKYHKVYDKRHLICSECRRTNNIGNTKGDDGLLELELLNDICEHALNVKKLDVQSTIVIISDDTYFKDKLFNCLKNQGVEILIVMPSTMDTIAMYRKL